MQDRLENKKSVFFDKKDSGYVQLTSPIYFFEMFAKKKLKCDVIIPQTVVFSKGFAKLWLFNSIKAQTPVILKKNSDKLSYVEICRVFCKVRHQGEYKIDSLTTLLDIVKAQRNEIITYIRMSRQTKCMNKVDLVKMCMESNNNGLSTMQEYLVNHSKAEEIYFVEYRRDDMNQPVNYRFFKKSRTEQTFVKSKQNDNVPVHIQTRSDDYDDDKSRDKGPEIIETMFKFFDGAMNANFTKLIKKVVDFTERGYRVKVKKVVAKFMQDANLNIIFLGLRELRVEFPENAPYDAGKIRDELRDNSSFENFQVLLKMFSKKPNRKAFKIPETIYEDDKEISAQLYSKLIIQKCVGDFCDYIMIEKNRGPLQIRKNILQDYKKYFGNKKLNEEQNQVTLPHEIAFQLILRTRECNIEVVDLLRKNKIFNRSSKHHYQDFDVFDVEEEYPFKFKKTEVFNLPNLYKSVKICKNCFVVYSLTMKYFDQQLQLQHAAQQQPNKTNNQTINKTLSVQNLQPKVSEHQETIHEDSQAYSHQLMITQTSRGEDVQKLERNIKSASHFRITKNVEPKTFKLHIPKPQIQSAKPGNQQKPINQIDVNRLTYGFLNYSKPPRPTSTAKQVLKNVSAHRNSESKGKLVKSESITNVNSGELSRRNTARKTIKLSNLNRISLYPSLELTLRLEDNQVKKEYNLIDVCTKLNLEYPPESVPDLLLDSVNYFTYKTCAVPYLVIMNQDATENILELTVPTQQLVVFLGDFFDNSFEQLGAFQDSIKESMTIILVNLPGQAYSIFDPEQVFDNIEHALLLDSLLQELRFKQIIQGEYSLKLIGVGYGGFVIQSFVAYCGNCLPNLSSVILINSFVEVDSALKDTLEKSKEVFKTCPDDMQDLCYHYWDTLRQTIQQQYDARWNPISLAGRLFIIDGCLNSLSLWQSLTNSVELKIYHGLKNCIVNIDQANLIVARSITDKKRQVDSQIEFLDCGHYVQNLSELLTNVL